MDGPSRTHFSAGALLAVQTAAIIQGLLVELLDREGR